MMSVGFAALTDTPPAAWTTPIDTINPATSADATPATTPVLNGNPLLNMESIVGSPSTNRHGRPA